MKKILLISFSLSLLGISGTYLHAKTAVYPLTENTWSNPEFVDRFTGSYAFDLQTNPKITQEESELLKEIAPVMQDNPNRAIQRIQAFIQAKQAEEDPSYSAALDYTIGSLYLQQQQVEQAVEKYKETIKKFPNFYRAYQNLGLANVQEGNYKEALPYLTKAVEIGGGNSTLWGLVGYCYLNLDKPTLALSAYNQALLFNSESKDWQMGKLNAHLNIGDYKTAIALLNEMLEEDPDQASLLLQKANAFLGLGNTSEAAATLELVRRMGESSPQSLLLLGDIYLNDNLSGLALSAYTEAMKEKEIGSKRLLSVVESLSARNATDEAVTFLLRLKETYADKLTNDQEMLSLNLEAKLAMAQGETDRAAEILKEIISKDPLNGQALINLGDYHRNEGDIEAAIIQYERAAKIDAVQFEAYVSLGRIYVTQRDYREALDYLKLANSLQPKRYLQDYIDQLERALRS